MPSSMAVCRSTKDKQSLMATQMKSSQQHTHTHTADQERPLPHTHTHHCTHTHARIQTYITAACVVRLQQLLRNLLCGLCCRCCYLCSCLCLCSYLCLCHSLCLCFSFWRASSLCSVFLMIFLKEK